MSKKKVLVYRARDAFQHFFYYGSGYPELNGNVGYLNSVLCYK